METSRMGKRGTIVVPVKLRKRFGLKEGDLLVTEEHEEGILLRPAVAVPVETYTPLRKAEFFLNNAITKEDYDEACEDIRAMGLDPKNIPHTDGVNRDDLPSNKEFDLRMKRTLERQRKDARSRSKSA